MLETMTDDYLNYPHLINAAMRGVVREVLRKISLSGLPGEHHFFITFMTGYEGVEISDQLKNRYPREMTVVLQHQFWDFHVDEDGFSVTLSFGGVPEKLYIPFASMVGFADPSVKFGLQFQPEDGGDIAEAIPAQANASGMDVIGHEPQHEDIDDELEPESAEIISLDTFRKK
jgi:hypothetical protein